MNEEKLLEKIRNSARNVEPPVKLEPEFIKDRLEEKKTGSRYRYYILRMAAAICLVILGGTALVRSVGWGNKSAGVEMAQDTASAEAAEESAMVTEDAADCDDVAIADAKSDAGVMEGAVNLDGVLAAAKSYEQIIERLETYYAECDTGYWEADGTEGTWSAEEGGSTGSVQDNMGKEKTAVEHEAGTGAGYSATNIQELGVDEGDIVKTDRNYIYILKEDSSVQILEARGATVRIKGHISNPQTGAEQAEEMYVSGDRLILLASFAAAELDTVAEDISCVDYCSGVKAYVYDISDRDKPKCLGSVEQEGDYKGSRLVDGYLYLYTDCYKSGIWDDRGAAPAAGYEKESYFPSVAGQLLTADEIYIPEKLQNTNYMIFSSVDLKNPNKVKDKKAVMSMSYQYYVSTSSIYLTQQEWRSEGDVTTIVKMDFKKGEIIPKAAGIVMGHINDSFSMNEYGGYLRVVTTSWNDSTTYNHLYVLDEQMNITGMIGNLAQGETIQSARFMGDMGYFVTYRNMDPLFSVDLSDPYHPEILGELKITGFSGYLHFYGGNLLFGLGYESDPDTGETLGIKLSMYDISDPANVQEMHKLVLDLDYAAALWNYKSLLIDPNKNLIGFLGEVWGPDCGEKGGNPTSYFVYQYDPELGFVQLFSELVEDTDSAGAYGTRGVYIGDMFYLIKVQDNTLEIYDMTQEYAKVGEATF